MKLPVSFLISALLLLISSTPSLSLAISPLEGIEALRSTLEGITDFTADFSQEKRISLLKRPISTNGSIKFKKPDVFLMKTRPPFEGEILMRDNLIEQKLGGENRRNRLILSSDQGLKKWFSKLSIPMKKIPDDMAIQAELNDSLYTLAISPKGKGSLKKITVSFHKNGEIRRLVISEKNGDSSILTLKNMKLNQGLSEKDFKF